MSMYNLLFGENPAAAILLSALNLKRESIPRYRDVFLARAEDGSLNIVIHTRTGGGNRAYYDSRESYTKNYISDGDLYPGPFNEDLRKLPTYVRDEDMEFDNTYANFTFTIPPAFLQIITILMETGMGAVADPEARWKKLLEDLQKDVQNIDTERAQQVGMAILEKLQEKGHEPGKIKIIEL